MKPQVPCWGVALSPSASFEAVPATTVQQTLRHWFEQWGRPQQLQFDHGQPWKSAGHDLPSLLELWLVGLGIEVLWSRPRRPQDNGIVERTHRVSQAWSAPEQCHTLEQLQHHLDEVARVQRQLYPNRQGLTRVERFPDLMQPRRVYSAQQEEQDWSIDLVRAYLAQGCWLRKVDSSGRISLYNHNYLVNRSLSGQTVWVRFEPSTNCWTCWNARGDLVASCPALEIQPEVIRHLRLHRSRAKHQGGRTKIGVTPPS